MSRKQAITVLLVDDSAEDRYTYETYLRQTDEFNYTFVHAEDAEQALTVCKQARLDCVLLDYQLPDLNGLEFLERLRGSETLVHVPVIMVTGRGSEKVAVQCLKLGAVDYVLKHEIGPEQLQRTVRGAVEIARLNSQVLDQQREREAAEAELRQSESRFRLLVDSVRDYSIVMLDPEGNVATWNAGARTLFGYHDHDIIGHAYGTLFPMEGADALADRDLRRATEQERVCADRWYVRRDKTRFWASSALTPVRDPHGQLLGYSWVVRDVTVRRRLLETLSNSLTLHAVGTTRPPDDMAATVRGFAQTIGRAALTSEDGGLESPESAALLGDLDRLLVALRAGSESP